jgi:hypothetical protein
MMINALVCVALVNFYIIHQMVPCTSLYNQLQALTSHGHQSTEYCHYIVDRSCFDGHLVCFLHDSCHLPSSCTHHVYAKTHLGLVLKLLYQVA